MRSVARTGAPPGSDGQPSAMGFGPVQPRCLWVPKKYFFGRWVGIFFWVPLQRLPRRRRATFLGAPPWDIGRDAWYPRTFLSGFQYTQAYMALLDRRKKRKRSRIDLKRVTHAVLWTTLFVIAIFAVGLTTTSGLAHGKKYAEQSLFDAPGMFKRSSFSSPEEWKAWIWQPPASR